MRHRNQAANAMRATPATAPMAIPTIAPVESEDDEEGEVSTGAAVGESVIESVEDVALEGGTLEEADEDGVAVVEEITSLEVTASSSELAMLPCASRKTPRSPLQH